MARPREREQRPIINYPLESPSWSDPTARRFRSAMEAAHDTATAFLITVYRGAGKYDCEMAGRRLSRQGPMHGLMGRFPLPVAPLPPFSSPAARASRASERAGGPEPGRGGLARRRRGDQLADGRGRHRRARLRRAQPRSRQPPARQAQAAARRTWISGNQKNVWALKLGTRRPDIRQRPCEFFFTPGMGQRALIGAACPWLKIGNGTHPAPLRRSNIRHEGGGRTRHGRCTGRPQDASVQKTHKTTGRK